jgi:hypothetical protein
MIDNACICFREAVCLVYTYTNDVFNASQLRGALKELHFFPHWTDVFYVILRANIHDIPTQNSPIGFLM